MLIRVKSLAEDTKRGTPALVDIESDFEIALSDLSAQTPATNVVSL